MARRFKSDRQRKAVMAKLSRFKVTSTVQKFEPQIVTAKSAHEAKQKVQVRTSGNIISIFLTAQKINKQRANQLTVKQQLDSLFNQLGKAKKSGDAKATKKIQKKIDKFKVDPLGGEIPVVNV